MCLTGGSRSPLILRSPLAQAVHASGVVTPGAHAAKDLTEKLTPSLTTVNLFVMPRSRADLNDENYRAFGKSRESKIPVVRAAQA
jgi:hypothetical protein